MNFPWAPNQSPLKGAGVFLSASVPDPQGNACYLDGPLEQMLMLRVIDRRVDNAVQSFVARVLGAGGRIIHGGHPKILAPIARQASNWTPPPKDPPVVIYQSEYFRKHLAPPGRDEMERAGLARVRWVSPSLEEAASQWGISEDQLQSWLPGQTRPQWPRELGRALLAMRIVMLLESKPIAGVCIGGMEGIEAEAGLYLSLGSRLPNASEVYVFRTTFGASARLQGAGIRFADEGLKPIRPPSLSASTAAAGQPSTDTAKADLEATLSYDNAMAMLVARIAQNG
jgi:hypothetical protein